MKTGGGNIMHPSHLRELITLEESYWWHVAKRKLAASLIMRLASPPARIVEGGLGSARNLLEFQNLGYDVAGFDLLPEAVEHARGRGLEETHVHDLQRPWPLPRGSHDAALLLDVIEHMRDPVEVLGHAATVLRPSGIIVVTVPAYPGLFGDWDKQLGHYRRYTKAMLHQHAAAARLKVSWLRHWCAFSLPPAMIVRGYQRLVPRNRPAKFPRVPSWINRVLLSVATMERQCMKKIKIPFGLSLVGVLEK